jgi:hypothetical protein
MDAQVIVVDGTWRHNPHVSMFDMVSDPGTSPQTTQNETGASNTTNFFGGGVVYAAIVRPHISSISFRCILGNLLTLMAVAHFRSNRKLHRAPSVPHALRPKRVHRAGWACSWRRIRVKHAPYHVAIVALDLSVTGNSWRGASQVADEDSVSATPLKMNPALGMRSFAETRGTMGCSRVPTHAKQTQKLWVGGYEKVDIPGFYV